MATQITWKCDKCGTTKNVEARLEDSAISEDDRWSPDGWSVRDGKVLCDLHENEWQDEYRKQNPDAVLLA